jgi:hypothetical protein
MKRVWLEDHRAGHSAEATAHAQMSR